MFFSPAEIDSFKQLDNALPKRESFAKLRQNVKQLTVLESVDQFYRLAHAVILQLIMAINFAIKHNEMPEFLMFVSMLDCLHRVEHQAFRSLTQVPRRIVSTVAINEVLQPHHQILTIGCGRNAGCCVHQEHEYLLDIRETINPSMQVDINYLPTCYEQFAGQRFKIIFFENFDRDTLYPETLAWLLKNLLHESGVLIYAGGVINPYILNFSQYASECNMQVCYHSVRRDIYVVAAKDLDYIAIMEQTGVMALHNIAKEIVTELNQSRQSLGC